MPDPPPAASDSPSPELSPWGERLFRWRPALALGLALLICVAAVNGAQLGLDFTPQRIFESDDEAFATLEHLQEVFGRDDSALVLHVEAAEGVFAPEPLDYLRRLHRALRDTPGVIAVDDLTTAVSVEPGSPFPLPLVPPGEPSLAELERARERARAAPLINGRLVAESGRAALVLVQLDPTRTRFEDLDPIVNRALEAARAVPRPEGVETLITGIPAVRVLIVERLIQDQLTYFPVCTILFFAALWVLFRDVRAVVIPLLAVGISLVLTVGVMGATGENLDVINNVLPVLIFVIAISDGIHLIARYRRELGQGTPQRVAIWNTVRHLAVACFLTSVTTAAGFASLGVAEISILARFGFYAAGGVLIAYLVTIVFMPLAFSWLGPLTSAAGRRADQLTDRAAHSLGDFSLRHRKAILLVGAVVMLTALALATRVREQNNLYEAFPEDDALVQANQRLERDFSGVIPVSLVVTCAEGVDPLDPQVLAYLEHIDGLLEAHPAFSNELSLLDLLAEWNLARHGGDPAWRKPPATAAECRLALVQLQAMLAQRGAEDQLRRVYAPEQRMLRVFCFTGDGGANALHDDVEELQRELARDRERQEALGLTVLISGDGPVASAGVNRLISDLLGSLMLAFVFIFATMWLLLRSLRAALVSMIPNVFPLLLTLGVMGALGIDLRVTTVIVFSVSLGLAVDDTIHFMARFREEWRKVVAAGSEGGDPYELAIRRTFLGTGSAIVATTVLLAVGFMVLLLSRFPVTSTFALCLEVTVVAALIGDLLLLPACLVLIRPFKA